MDMKGKQILGIHHVTAIAGDPQRNLDFYSGVLGLRLVKLTVNYDDPSTYHLYYGDYSGHPGTLITFFPWKGVPRGVVGSGQMTVTSFSVPPGSLEFWAKRLTDLGIPITGPASRFGDHFLSLQDYDGMQVELVTSRVPDPRSGWLGGPIPDEAAIRGIHGATFAVATPQETIRLLTETMGFHAANEEGGRQRFEISDGSVSAHVDLIATPLSQRGRQGAGSVHHIAWRTPDDQQQLVWREELVREGLGVSPVMDRKYFHSIYYREPNGILFEIATDPPGMTIDQPLEELGHKLVLPPWLESHRAELVAALPKLAVPELQHA